MRSRVQSFGPDTYIVTYSSLYGSGKARTAAIRTANGFCETRGAPMRPLDEQIVLGTITSFSLVFACASDAAPSSYDATLGPDIAQPRIQPRSSPEPCRGGCHAH